MVEVIISLKDVFVLFTMDCEPAKIDTMPYASRMSGSGPSDYLESERSIRGYVGEIERYGFPTTLFLHPEVAVRHQELILELQGQGACLGLHLHPYKLSNGHYRRDLGAYSASRQRKIVEEAMAVWEKALDQKPLYFRAGYFSANDNTFRVLRGLGFKGGSLSCPGRVLPEHCSVWSGAEPYPHRAHLNFRQLKGESDFAEVPISVDFQRPLQRGEAGEKGYEWLYIPSHAYDHKEILKNLLKQFEGDSQHLHVIVTDTHNDQDYSNPKHPARLNLDLILSSIKSLCADMNMRPIGSTLNNICDLILSADG
jgi:hypothetical protein